MCSDKVTRLIISLSDVRLIRGQIGQIDLYFNPLRTIKHRQNQNEVRFNYRVSFVLFFFGLAILTNDSGVEKEASARPWLCSIALEVQLPFIIRVKFAKPTRLHCSSHRSTLGI